MKLLLINPRFPESLWSMQWVLDNVRPGVRAINPPLGLATVAALCPPDWEIEIIDENIETLPLETDADIVGVGGMAVQYDRQLEIVRHFRDAGHYVIVGGSYASLCPENYEGKADTVVSGEAEYIFKRFCADYLAGAPERSYREDGTVDLADSPTPRFDLLKLHRYRSVSLQFSRGCPFRCEFCDIIVMFGRKPRTKSPEQICAELDAILGQGVTDVFFTDDNFIGHRPKALKLLRRLQDFQAERGVSFRFGTEASVDLAQHPKLMQAMVDANFGWVFMGIESPDPASLAETQKDQNLREDLLESVYRVYSYGLDIYAGFIVGFDNDTTATFGVMRDFINASGVQMANLSMLQAIPHTPLYERLEEEGRLREGGEGRIDVRLYTNVQPKRMSYEEMVEGYRRLYFELYSDEAIAQRVQVKLEKMAARPVDTGAAGLARWAQPAMRILSRGVLAGGPQRLKAAWRSTRVKETQVPAQALIDWALAVGVRDYLERNFNVDDELAREAVQRARRAFEASPAVLTLERREDAADLLRLELRGRSALRYARRKAGALEEALRRSPARLELDLRGQRATGELTRLLERLAPYSTRVRVRADPELVADERADLWRFVVALPEPGVQLTALAV